MKPPACFLRAFVLALLCLGSIRSLSAQNVLFAEHKGKMLAVREARNGGAIVEENGKRVLADGRKFFLKKIDEFLPVFISIRGLAVKSTHVELMGDMTGDINHAFSFEAEFSSAYHLEHVFVVLELELRNEKSLFIYEVGKLEPRKPSPLHLSYPISYELGEGKFHLHLFSDGLEVFQSEQPIVYREQMLDRMVTKRIKGAQDGPPQLLFGPPVEYPAKLAKSNTRAEATVKFRVTNRGSVLDPVLISTTDPAFGENALSALRLWRFLPRIKDGRPVETMVTLPVVADPVKN